MTTTAAPTTLADWTEHAAAVRPRTGVYVDGGFRPAESGATFDSVNPATGDVLARVASAQAVDVDARWSPHARPSAPVTGPVAPWATGDGSCCGWPNW